MMKYRAYIDIETTGLSCYDCDLTVIGIALEKAGKCRTIQLIEGNLCREKLLKILKGVDEIYSYNGSRFDLPFIENKFRIDLKGSFRHTDLMYDCWRQNLKGGLKVVERLLGIKRNLEGIDGSMAVMLWYDYFNNNDRLALKKLLAYNLEDVVNLRLLRRKLGIK
ncbi:MAG: ribonuclease H-like domain-containing protein [Phycisphaerae bacterium]|nr:ribonuclease H-like domain-containing protein [Phycisphaerae bacterium]